MNIDINKLEIEIKEMIETAKRNLENGKYRNDKEKNDCTLIYIGEKKAYMNILKFIKYSK